MATELMKNWIVELHNPERKQTTGYLGRINPDGERSNCCLGVLCEVKGDQGEARFIGELDTQSGYKTIFYGGASGLPNPEIIDEVLDVEPGTTYTGTLDLFTDESEDGYPYQVPADEANDRLKMTFKEIAHHLSLKYLNDDEAFEVRKRVEDLGWA